MKTAFTISFCVMIGLCLLGAYLDQRAQTAEERMSANTLFIFAIVPLALCVAISLMRLLHWALL